MAGPLGELLAELRAPSDASEGNSSELPTPPLQPPLITTSVISKVLLAPRSPPTDRQTQSRASCDVTFPAQGGCIFPAGTRMAHGAALGSVPVSHSHPGSAETRGNPIRKLPGGCSRSWGPWGWGSPLLSSPLISAGGHPPS